MPRGDARRELLHTAALRLFSEHGVAGTSLQMIADALGVAKAAVYHHHKTKADIVAAVFSPPFDDIGRIVATAGQEPGGTPRVSWVVRQMADHAVRYRAFYAVMLRDIAVSRLAYEDPRYASTFTRLSDLLAGSDPSPQRRVHVGMFLSGLATPASDPSLSALSDADLRAGIVTAGDALLLSVPARFLITTDVDDFASGGPQ